MIKHLSLAVISAVILSCFTPAFAYDHQTTKQQAKQISINNNHNKLSKKEMKAYAKQQQKRQQINNRNHNKFNYSNNKDHDKFNYYNNKDHNKFSYNNKHNKFNRNDYPNTPNFNYRYHNKDHCIT